MKKSVITFFAICIVSSSFGQYRVNAGTSIGSGAAMFTIGAEREFNVFSDNFHINPGVRFSVFSGNDLEYITAPAKYTSNDGEVDIVRIGTVQNNFANLYARLGYDFTKKLSLSFDIDVVGVSFGREQKNNAFSEGESAQNDTYIRSATINASPTKLNLLLIGDNDIGSLNSTLSLSYDVTNRLGIDLGASLVFTEFTTNDKIGYDGNDRFRNKNMMGYLGLSYLLGEN